MNQFFTEVGKVNAIDKFAGGNDKQRTHLNTMIAAINKITTEAQRSKATDALLSSLEGMKPESIYIIANGASTLVRIPMEVL